MNHNDISVHKVLLQSEKDKSVRIADNFTRIYEIKNDIDEKFHL